MKGRARQSNHRAILATLLLFVAAVASAQSPPANLHLEGDHWTAWSPPVPPEGANVYIIQTGDTLWAIAGTMLGDPYLWPQLWEANQYILDAHWIYPGDPLLVPAGAQVFQPDAGMVGQPLSEAAADGLADELAAADAALDENWFEGAGSTKPPVPLGTESQIYCSGYIGPEDEEFPFEIAASEYDFLTPSLNPSLRENFDSYSGLFGRGDTEKYGLAAGDIVYLAGGRNEGLSAGELLTVVAPENQVSHPVSREPLGRFYRYRGRIRVLSVQDETAIGEIVRSCDIITVGSKLRLFEPEPVPLRRPSPMRPVNFPHPEEALVDSPTIVMSFDGVITLGQGYLVFIDRGESQDVLPGDIFTVYRIGRRGFPPLMIGEVGILSVTENTALGNILESRYSMFLGDRLVLK